MKKPLSILLIISTLSAFSQQATVIDPNAVTVPRFANATAVTTAIPSPVQGMFIYRNDTQSFWYYTSAGWTNLAASVSGTWATVGNNISNTNSGNVGVGTGSPTSKLNVNGQVTIDQKNFGGFGGLLIKGKNSTANHPNIGLTMESVYEDQEGNSETFDMTTGLINGNIINNNYGYEEMDMTFHVSGGVDGLAEKFRIKGNGNVGIGLQPGHKLHIGNNYSLQSGLRVEGPEYPNIGDLASFGGHGRFLVDIPGIVGGRFSILENGNIGIGNPNPAAPLHFANNLNSRKLLLYSGNNNNNEFHGFGVRAHPNGLNTLMTYQIPNSSDGHLFVAGVDNTNTKNLLMINGNGSIGVGTNVNVGESGQALVSNGPGKPPRWASAGRQFISAALTPIALSGNTPIDIPNFSLPILPTDSSRFTMYFRVGTFKNCLAGSCATKWRLHVHLDGDPTPVASFTIDAVSYSGLPESEALYGPLVISTQAGVNRVLTLKGQNLFNDPTVQFVAISTHATAK